MEKLDKYRNHIIEIIKKYENTAPSCADMEVQAICDRENDHYQVMNGGWQNEKAV